MCKRRLKIDNQCTDLVHRFYALYSECVVLRDEWLHMVVEFADHVWHAQDEEGWEINMGQMLLAYAEGSLSCSSRSGPCPLLGTRNKWSWS